MRENITMTSQIPEIAAIAHWLLLLLQLLPTAQILIKLPFHLGTSETLSNGQLQFSNSKKNLKTPNYSSGIAAMVFWVVDRSSCWISAKSIVFMRFWDWSPGRLNLAVRRCVLLLVYLWLFCSWWLLFVCEFCSPLLTPLIIHCCNHFCNLMSIYYPLISTGLEIVLTYTFRHERPWNLPFSLLNIADHRESQRP